MENKVLLVTNRSASAVVYSIPEEGIRRTYEPGEKKRIQYSEIEKLFNQPGGNVLVENYLLIEDADSIKELGMHTEPEYYMNKEEIIDLMNNGSLDAWLDCLDFAPTGVIEMIKDLSVKLPLGDYNKRKAVKEKTGFDIDAALKHLEDEPENTKSEDKPQRRVQTEDNTAARRANIPTYKTVKK